MGHIMQPVIGRLFQDKHKIELKDADYAITHPKHDWMRSHFDFISADGTCLVEAKNYNAGVRSRYDADANRIPDADFAQLVHESACHNINRIFLAVLFGGSEFVTIEFQITEDMKDDLVQRMAKLWAYCKTDTLPPAETIEQTKLVYPSSTDESIVATQNIEVAVAQLKQYKASIKALEDQSEALEVAIRNTMGDKSEIVSISGDTLVTWRSSKSSKRFSSDLFKQAMPDIYEQFVIEQPGSRRFLVK
jgi:predicted phage-related endonuclease